MTDLGPNAALINDPDALENLFTPALVIDLDVFDHNLTRMAAYCQQHSIAFRPHAKTHKSVEIAKRQIAAGAVGVCCATLGEADVLSNGGIDNILITTPIIGALKVKRFLELYKTSSGMKVVVDNEINAADMANAAKDAGINVDVLVALDLGLHRIGARSPEQGVEIVKIMSASDNLTFKGIHAYSGNLQHITDYSDRVKQVTAANDIIRDLIAQLKAIDITPELVSGAGTGSHLIDAVDGVFNEMQVGSFIFMDIEYTEIDWPEATYEQSLFVATRVVSNNRLGVVVTDGGTKRFSMGGPAPQAVGQDHWSYAFLGDEHGQITFGDHNEQPEYGAVIIMIPPHCDPTVNLYDYYHIIQDGQLVDIWPIEARGAI